LASARASEAESPEPAPTMSAELNLVLLMKAPIGVRSLAGTSAARCQSI
jgi:hypothetical protein